MCFYLFLIINIFCVITTCNCSQNLYLWARCFIILVYLGFYMYYIPSLWGLIIGICLVSALALWWVGKKNKVSLLFGEMFDSMSMFFANILEEATYSWTTKYITSMFFVILLYNILWLLTDFISPIFGFNQELWEYNLAEYIWFATSDYHFNIAMALIGVLIMLWVQFANMSNTQILWNKVWQNKIVAWFVRLFNFVYEYLPFWWKNIITIERWSFSPFVYYPLWLIVKLFDIWISMFVWFLDIIWLLAKIVSLSFRLFWNMLSGTALLTVLVSWLWASTLQSLWFEFPVLWPIVLFAQWMLVACIQAFVFPLLIAIFIKVARMGSEEQTA